MTLPKRLPHKPKRHTQRVRSRAHLAFVRTFRCCVPGCDRIDIEAAHIDTGNNPGVGVKSDDRNTISLCTFHHRLGGNAIHVIGERAFARYHQLDLNAIAREFASKSPPLRRLGVAPSSPPVSLPRQQGLQSEQDGAGGSSAARIVGGPPPSNPLIDRGQKGSKTRFLPSHTKSGGEQT